MASRPWNDDDVEFLRKLSDRRDWFDHAKPRFEDRTEASVRCMMQKVRLELGINGFHDNGNAWMTDAISGTTRLLAALTLTGLRP